MKVVSPKVCADPEAGFSLVEVLVTLVLVSVMATAMAAMTGQFRQLIKNTDRNGDKMALQAATRYMTRQLEQAEAMQIDGKNGGSSPYMTGEINKVNFVANIRLGAISYGLRNLEFELTDGEKLVQSNALRRQSVEANALKLEPAVVLDGVQALEFGYFGSVTDGEAPAWHDSWSAVARLPQAISVTVKQSRKDNQFLTARGVALLSAQ